VEFSVNGHEVVVRGQYSSRGYSSKADFLFTVENGLIASWRMRYWKVGTWLPHLLFILGRNGHGEITHSVAEVCPITDVLENHRKRHILKCQCDPGSLLRRARET